MNRTQRIRRPASGGIFGFPPVTSSFDFEQKAPLCNALTLPIVKLNRQENKWIVIKSKGVVV
jgi:hypothetical protein